jgi:hypothetical protein
MKVYERTLEEFKESFKYGKVYMIRSVDMPNITLSRAYFCNGKVRVQPTVKRRHVKGLPEGVQLEEGDFFYLTEDGALSLLKKRPILRKD